MSTHTITTRPAIRLAATTPMSGRLAVHVTVAVALLVAGYGVLQIAAVENGAAGTLVGMALVLVARPLALRRRRAQLAALVLVLASLALDADGIASGGTAFVAVVAALLLATPVFRADGDPATRRMLVPAAALLAIGLAADVAHAGGALAHPLAATMLAGAILLGARTLNPWRGIPRADGQERQRVAEFVRRHGTDTLSPFALRADKRAFFDESQQSMLSFRVVAGVALVSGDPLGDQQCFPILVSQFAAFAHRRGWQVAALGVSAEWLSLWRELGLRVHYTGDEAIVDPRTFSLDGRAIRKVRQSVARLEREGYDTSVLSSREISPKLATELARIAERWREGRCETGFSMAFEGAEVRSDRDDLYVIATDAQGAPRGFLHFGAAPAARTLSLSSMRRERDTPNGLNEFLICRTLQWARQEGMQKVSLNFAAFALLLDPPGELDAVSAFERRLLKRFQGRFQLERLLGFSEKFAPTWVPRYAAYPSLAALPRVALAAMLAEAYVAAPRPPWTRGHEQ